MSARPLVICSMQQSDRIDCLAVTVPITTCVVVPCMRFASPFSLRKRVVPFRKQTSSHARRPPHMRVFASYYPPPRTDDENPPNRHFSWCQMAPPSVHQPAIRTPAPRTRGNCRRLCLLSVPEVSCALGTAARSKGAAPESQNRDEIKPPTPQMPALRATNAAWPKGARPAYTNIWEKCAS